MTRNTLTTTAGAPIADNQNSQSAGPRGPLLMQDYQLLEKLAHQNRERIPERVVHAKGSGAYGTLTVTNDVTRYTKAKFLSQVGKQTQILMRFSTVAGERGAATVLVDRIEAWSLLVLGLAAGVVAPHPVTTTLWTAAARAFARSGDAVMVERLTSATKFGPRIKAGLRGRTSPHLRFA